MPITLHTRINTFVTWIRPDPDTADDARKQRDEVRARIKGRAEADGLIVRATPNSGSFVKATGLRRHMFGAAEHEGQDIDCPFVVSPKDEDGDVLTDLLMRFDRYAEESYPKTPREQTKSSIKLKFVASKLNFDLVPMLAVDGDDERQILLRANGERRQTSIQRHVEFTRSRTKTSQDLRGPVVYNDGVRLVKWWREYRVTQSKILTTVPTFLLDLLSAKAFDELSVQPKWPETLVTWFDRIQSYARYRTEVSFRDFVAPQAAKITAKWKVIDPLNGENNVVPTTWTGIEFDELRDWAQSARDKIQQAIAYEFVGRDNDAVASMADVFGPSFKNHSEGA